MLDPDRKLFRWGPISACPLFMYYTIKPSFDPMKKKFEECYPDSLILFYNDKVTWLLDFEQLSLHSQKFVDINIYQPQRKQRYFNLWKKYTHELNKVFDSISDVKIEKLQDKDLIKTFKLFSEKYYSWWTHTMSVELVTVTLEPKLGSLLDTYFEDERDKNMAFATLTAPEKLTFYRRETLDLLEIIASPKQKREELLSKHQHQFHWIHNSYLKAKEITQKDFSEELQQLERENWQDIKQEIENYSAKIKKEKHDTLKTIKASEETRDLSELVTTFASMQDDRKMYNFMADYYLELFAKAFAEKFQFTTRETKSLLPNEIIENDRQTCIDLIKQRQNILVIDVSEGREMLYSGDKGVALVNRFDQSPQLTGTTLHGQLASSGNVHYFRGPARIVLSIDQINLVKEGDILITTMTSPDFVIGMKKAGAVITDTGGMLSHAAIVSRELGIPCIVGTEIATKVIENGDIVELHCSRGTIKIVKAN